MTPSKVAIALLFVGVFVVAYHATTDFLTVPVVYESWSLQRCVAVWDRESRYTCSDLPEKYTRVWVK